MCGSLSIAQKIFTIYLCIPLVYLPWNYNLTNIIKALLLIGIGLTIVIKSNTLADTYLRYKKFGIITKIFFLGLAILSISGLISSDTQLSISFTGAPPIYLGLIAWASILISAVYFRKVFTEYMTSTLSILILGLVMAASLIIDWHNISTGIRVSGIIAQSTTLAMYAVISCAIVLYRLITNSHASKFTNSLLITVLVLSISTVILSHSRIGYISLLITLGIFGFRFASKIKIIFLVTALMIFIASAFLIIQKNTFYRFQANNLNNGITYRTSLYFISAKDVIKNYFLIGKGPGHLPVAINDKNKVPEDLVDTLSQGIIFSSTHNLFLDMAYFFGLIITSLVFFSSIYYLVIGLINKNDNIFILSLIFFVLVLNALFNVPSIELTSMYFVALVALYKNLQKSKKHA